MYKLEDRILFDGAAVADVADAQQEADAQQQEAAAATEAEEAAQQEAAANADGSDGGESDGSVAGGDSDDPGSLESVLAAIETANTGSDGQRIDVLVVSDSLENAEDIANATSDDTIVVRYDARTTSAADLMQQITDALGGNLADSIGFATESGENAHVQLFADTDTSLDTVNNSVHQDFFHSLNSLMDEGAQVNLFASNLASTAEGTALVDAIGDAVDHDVAASTDETGSESAGGDWNLEYSTNGVEVDASDVYLDENLIDNFDSLLEDDINHEVAFINSSVMNVDEILDDLDANVEVVMLESGSDGLDYITDYLNESGVKYDAVHIITHGNEGYFVLNGQIVDGDYVSENASDFVQWRNALSDDADIMIYGCNLTGSLSGESLVANIASLTGADVAASTDSVGGSDWSLDYNIGDINYSAFDIDSYAYQLADEIVNSTVDNVLTAGTLRYALANVVAGDSITFDEAIAGSTITLANPTMDIGINVFITNATTGSITVDGGAGAAFNITAGTTTLDNITLVSSGDALTIAGGGVTIDGGTTTTVNGGMTNAGTVTVNSGSTLDVTGTFATSSTVNINGSMTADTFNITAGATTIGATGDLDVSGTMTAGNNVNINGSVMADTFNLTGGTTAIAATTGSLDVATSLDTSAGTFNVNGTLDVGDAWTTGGTFAAGTSSLVIYSGDSQTVEDLDYNDLELAGTNFTAFSLASSVNDLIISGTADFDDITATIDNDLVVDGGTLSATALDVSAVAPTGSLVFTANGGTLDISGAFTATGANFTAGLGTVDYSGAGQTVAAVDYYDLILSASGTKAVANALQVAHDLTLSDAAVLSVAAGGVNVDHDMAVSGTAIANVNGGLVVDNDLTVTAGTVNVITGNLTVSNNMTLVTGNVTTSAGGLSVAGLLDITDTGTVALTTGTYTTTTGTVEYSYAGAQTINDWTFYDLTLSTSGTKTANSALQVNNDLTISDAAILSVTAGGLTVDYDMALSGTAVANVTGGIVVGNDLTVTAGTVNATTGDLTVGNDVTVTAGAVNVLTGNFAVGNDMTLVAGNVTTSGVDGDLSVVGLLDISGTGIVTLGGTGTYSTTTGTVDYSYAGAQDINDWIFYDLTLSTSGIKTAANALNVTNDLSVEDTAVATMNTGVTLTVGNDMDIATGATVNLSGTGALSVATGTLTVTGTLNYNGGGFVAGSGTVIYDGGPQTIMSGTTAVDYWNLTLTGSGDKTALNDFNVANNMIIDTGVTLVTGGDATLGDMTLDGGSMTVADGVTITAQGQFTMINSSTLTIDADGGSGGGLFKVEAVTAPGLNVQSSSTVTVNGTLEVNTSADIATTAILTIGTTGTLTQPGSLRVDGDMKLDAGSIWTYTGSFIAGDGTVEYDISGAAIDATVLDLTYNNLTLTGVSDPLTDRYNWQNQRVTDTLTLDNLTLTALNVTSNVNNLTMVNPSILNVTNSLDIDGGSAGFTAGDNTTVNYSGNNAQFIAAYDYYNLTLSVSDDKTAAGDIGIAGAFTLGGTAAFVPSNYTVTYNGGHQDIALVDYHHLVLAGGNFSTKTLNDPGSGDFQVAGQMSILAGSDITLDVQDVFNITNAHFTNTGSGTVLYSEVAANQIIKSLHYNNLEMTNGDKVAEGDIWLTGNIDNNTTNSYTGFDAATNTTTITFEGGPSGLQQISEVDFYNLVVDGGSRVTAVDSTTTLTIANDLTFTGSGGYLRFVGDNAVDFSVGNVFTPGTGQIYYEGSDRTIALLGATPTNYYDLRLSSANYTLDGTTIPTELTVDHDLDLTTGAVLDVNVDMTVTNDLIFDNNSDELDFSGTDLTIGGVLTAGNGLVRYDGAGDQNVYSGAADATDGYWNVLFETSGTKTATGSIYAGNNMTINDGVTVAVSGGVEAQNDLTVNNTSILTVDTTLNVGQDFTLDDGSTATITGAADVGNDLILNNTLAVVPVTTVNIGGTLDVVNEIQINDGSTLNVDEDLTAVTLTFEATSGGNLFFAGTTLDVSGTFTAGTGTVTYDGAAQTVDVDDNYFDLVFEGTGTKTATGDLTVDNDMTINNGVTVGVSGALDAGNDLTVNKTSILTVGTTLNVTNDFTLDDGSVATITGAADVGNDLILNNTTPTGTTTVNVGETLDVVNEIQINDGSTLNVDGDLTTDTLTFEAASLGNLFFAGTDLTVSGTLPAAFVAGSGTVTYDGANQNVTDLAYWDLDLDGTGTKTAATGVSVANDLTFLASVVTLNVVSGTVDVQNTFTHGNGTVQYSQATGNQNIENLDYYNLALTGSSTKHLVGDTRIKNNFTLVGTGGFAHENQMVEYNGDDQAILDVLYYDLILTSDGTSDPAVKTSGTASTLESLRVANDLTMNANTELVLYNSISVGNDVSLNTASTINYAGDSQVVEVLSFGGSPAAYQNLVISESGTKFYNSDALVNVSLLVKDTSELIVNGTFSLTATVAVEDTATLTLKGTVAQPSSFTAEVGTTVKYAATGDQIIIVGNYGNLVLEGTGNRTLAGDIGIARAFTVESTVVFVPVTYAVNFNGDVAQDVTATTYYDIILSGTGTKTWGGSGLTLANDLIFQTDVTLQVPTNLNAVTDSSHFITDPDLTGPRGTVQYTGVNQDVTALPYHNLQLSGAIGTMLGDLDMTGSLTIDVDGTLDTDGFDITLPGNWTNNGTFIHGDNTVTMNGTTLQTITTGDDAFYQLVLEGDGTTGGNKSVADNLNVDENLYINDGITVTVAGNLAVTGLVQVNEASTLNVTGTTGIGTTLTLNGGSTVGMTGNATVGTDLTLNAASIATFGGTLTVSGNTVLNAASDLNVTGTADFVGSLTINGGSTVDVTGVSTVGVDLTINDASVVTFVNNLTVTGDTYINDGSTLDVNGDYSTTDLIFEASQNGELIFGGVTLTIGGAFSEGNGLVTYDGASQTVLDLSYYDLKIAGTGAYTVTLTNTIHDFTVDSSVTTLGAALSLTRAGVPTTSYGSLSIASGATLDAAGFAITLPGDWTNAGTYTHNNNTVTFNGVAQQTVTSGGSSFYNFTVLNTSATESVVLADALVVDNNLTVTDGDLDSGATGFDINVAGNWFVDATNGTFTHNNNLVTFDGTSNITSGGSHFYDVELHLATSATQLSDVTVDNDFTITVTTGIWDTGGFDLVVLGDWTNYDTFLANDSNIYVGGNWYNDAAATFTAGTSTVTFDGTNVAVYQIITSSGDFFYNIILNGTGIGAVQADAIDINNDFTLTSGDWDAAGFAINLAGDWLNNGGTFTHNNNEVTFDGTSDVTSRGSSFYDVILNGTSVTQLDDADVDNDLTLTSGAWNVPGVALNVDNDLFVDTTGTLNLAFDVATTAVQSTLDVAGDTVNDGAINLDGAVASFLGAFTGTNGTLTATDAGTGDVTVSGDNKMYFYGVTDLGTFTHGLSIAYYVGAVNQVVWGEDYYDLQIAEGNKVLGTNKDTTVANDFSFIHDDVLHTPAFADAGMLRLSTTSITIDHDIRGSSGVDGRYFSNTVYDATSGEVILDYNALHRLARYLFIGTDTQWNLLYFTSATDQEIGVRAFDGVTTNSLEDGTPLTTPDANHRLDVTFNVSQTDDFTMDIIDAEAMGVYFSPFFSNTNWYDGAAWDEVSSKVDPQDLTDPGAYYFGSYVPEDDSYLVVTHDADDGTKGSLRVAMEYSNAHDGFDVITFAGNGFDRPVTVELSQNTYEEVLEDGDLEIFAGQLRLVDSVIVDNTGVLFTVDATNSSGSSRALNVANSVDDVVVQINNMAFTEGVADNGAGIYNTEALFLNRVTVSDSTASEAGGGIYNDTEGNIQAMNLSVTGNSAVENGGGIYNNSGTLYLQQVTIAANTADSGTAGTYYGGGIYNNLGDVYADNITFSTNYAVDGSAIYQITSLDPLDPQAQTTLAYATIGLNTAATGGYALSADATLPGLWFIEDSIITENSDAVSAALNINPLITALNTGTHNYIGHEDGTSVFTTTAVADNGGWVQTLAMNAANGHVTASIIGQSTNSGASIYDARGYMRNGARDIGAYEYNAYVAWNVTRGGSYTTVQAAIDNALTQSGDHIEVVGSRIIVNGAAISIAKDLILTGQGEGVTVFDATGATHRVLTVSVGGSDAFVRISDMDFVGGTTSTGAGIYNSESLALNHVSVYGSVAATAGGGIYNDGGYVYLNRANIFSNTAGAVSGAEGAGGGIYNNLGQVRIVESTVRNNNTYGPTGSTAGAGIYNYDDGTGVSALTIVDSAVYNNVADGANSAGGAIYTSGASVLEFVNSTFAYNQAQYNGAFYITGGVSNFSNITVAYNETVNNSTGIADHAVGIYGGYVYIVNGLMVNNTNAGVVGQQDFVVDTGTSGTAVNTLYNNDYGQVFEWAELRTTPNIADNGGWTYSLALVNNASVVNQGTDAGVPGYDQRGYDTNTTRDIGAYEYSGIVAYYYNSLLTEGNEWVGTSTISAAGSALMGLTGPSTLDIRLVNTRILEFDATISLWQNTGVTATPQAVRTVNLYGHNEGGTTISGGYDGVMLDAVGTRYTVGTTTTYVMGTLNVERLTLSEGFTTGNGGAVTTTNANTAGQFNLTDVALVNNVALGNGGAIYAHGAVPSYGDQLDAKYTIANSLVANNIAMGSGGAAANVGSTITFTDSTVAYNRAFGNGGGIALLDSANATVVLTNSTLSFNSASGTGGGVYNLGKFGSTSSILAKNRSAGDFVSAIQDRWGNDLSGYDYRLVDTGTLTNGGHNLVEYQNGQWVKDPSVPNFFGPITDVAPIVISNGDILGTNSSLFAIDRIADNGGWSGTIALSQSSAALDNGTGAADQRHFNVNQTRDIGAYELNAIVAIAGGNNFSTIWEAVATGSSVTLVNSRIVEQDIHIGTTGTQSITTIATPANFYELAQIDANGLGRIFYIENSSANVTISNLMLVDGMVLNSTAVDAVHAVGNGGAVFNAGTLTLNEVSFATSFAQLAGGGIYSLGSLTVTTDAAYPFMTGLRGEGAYFACNSSESDGGAIYAKGTMELDGGTSSYDYPRLRFSYNSANVGGAIYAKNVSNPTSGYAISGVLFDTNSAQVSGGALYVEGTNDVSVTETDFDNNMAMQSGGAVYGSTTANLTFHNTDFNWNKTFRDGGGIYFDGLNSALSKLTFISETSTILTHGFNDNSSYAGDGGAIYITRADELRIYSTSITSQAYFANNDALHDGGAIYMADSGDINIGDIDQSISNSVTFHDNIAGDDGGALFMLNSGDYYSSENISFYNNVAGANPGMLDGSGLWDINVWTGTGRGGAIYVQDSGTLTFTNVSSVYDNTARNYGGGFYLENNASANISYSKLADNAAGEYYSGVWLDVHDVADTNAGRGGGIYVTGVADVTLTDMDIYDNHALTDGGAVFMDNDINLISWVTTADTHSNTVYTSSSMIDPASVTVGGTLLTEGSGINDLNVGEWAYDTTNKLVVVRTAATPVGQTSTAVVNDANLTINSSGFDRNIVDGAGRGGAVYVTNAAAMNITNTTFARNDNTALYVGDTVLDLNFTTFAYNVGTGTGGVDDAIALYFVGSGGSSSISIANSIIHDNSTLASLRLGNTVTVTGSNNNIFTDFTSFAGTNVSDLTTGTYTDITAYLPYDDQVGVLAQTATVRDGSNNLVGHDSNAATFINNNLYLSTDMFYSANRRSRSLALQSINSIAYRYEASGTETRAGAADTTVTHDQRGNVRNGYTVVDNGDGTISYVMNSAPSIGAFEPNFYMTVVDNGDNTGNPYTEYGIPAFDYLDEAIAEGDGINLREAVYWIDTYDISGMGNDSRLFDANRYVKFADSMFENGNNLITLTADEIRPQSDVVVGMIDNYLDVYYTDDSAVEHYFARDNTFLAQDDATRITIDGGGSYRIWGVQDATDVSDQSGSYDFTSTFGINNLTMQNGFIEGRGGIISNIDAGWVYINNSVLQNSIATNLIVDGEDSQGWGGAIYSNATMVIADSTITGNYANGTNGEAQSAGLGGGIYNSGTLTVMRSLISDNYVAGIYSPDDSTGNNSGTGGALFNATGGTLTIKSSTFSGNYITAGTSEVVDGAALAVWDGTATLYGNTFAHNISYNGTGQETSPSRQGYAVYFRDGTVDFQNNIVAQNYIAADTNQIRRDIIVDNDVTFTDFNNIIGSYYLDSANYYDFYTNVGTSGDILGFNANGFVPGLNMSSELLYNGGMTQNYRILSNSVAIAHGDYSGVNMPDYDQRNLTVGTGQVRETIGAYELLTWTEINSYIRDAALPANGIGYDFDENRSGWQVNLRNALYLSDQGATVEVNILPDPDDPTRTDYATFSIEYGELLISNALTLTTDDVGYGDILTIDAQSNSRAFLVSDPLSATPINVTLENLNIINGVAVASDRNGDGGTIFSTEGLTLTDVTISDSSADGDGGAIYVLAGGLTMTDVTIDNASSKGDGGAIAVLTDNLTGDNVTITNSTAAGSGGALYLPNNDLVDLQNSFINDNSADGNGGGIYFSGGSMTIDSTAIRGNSVTDSNKDGGGLYIAASGLVTITKSTIAENTAGRGAGMFVYAGSLDIVNSTFSANTAVEDGGGLYFSGTNLSLTYVTIANNQVGNSFNGGGIYMDAGLLDMTNTIIAQNYSNSGLTVFNDFYLSTQGGVTSASTSAIGASTGYDFTGFGNILGVAGEIANLQLDTVLRDNGGNTPTLYVWQNSVLVGAGNHTTSPLVTDSQNGKTRLNPSTIGAYESIQTIYYYVGDGTGVTTEANWNLAKNGTGAPLGSGGFLAADNTFVFDEVGAGGVLDTDTWTVSDRSLVQVGDSISAVPLAAFTISGIGVLTALDPDNVASNARLSVVDYGNMIFTTITQQNFVFTGVTDDSTVTYNYAGNQTLYTAGYGNLVIAGGGTKTAGFNVTVAGDLTLAATTTLNAGTNSVTVTGDALGTGSVTGGILSLSTVSSLVGNLTGTTVSITGDADITGNLTGTTVSIIGDADITGDVIANGNATFGGLAAIREGTVDVGGTLTMTGNVTLDRASLDAPELILSGNIATVAGSVGNIEGNTVSTDALTTGFGSSAATITVNDYSTLTWDLTQNVLLDDGTFGPVAGSAWFNVQNITVDATPGTKLTFTTPGTVTLKNIDGTDADGIAGILGLTGDSGVLIGDAVFNFASLELGGLITLSGDFQVNQGVSFIGSVTLDGTDVSVTSVNTYVLFNEPVSGTGQNLTINAGTDIGINDINWVADLTVNPDTLGGGGEIALDGTIIATGNVEFNGPVVISSGAVVSVTGDTLNLNDEVSGEGDFTLKATSTTVDSELDVIDMTGNLTLSAGSFIANDYISFTNLSISSPATLSMGSNDLTTTGNLTNAGELYSDGTVTVGGDITNRGTTFTIATLDASGNITNTSAGTMTITTLNLLDDSTLSMNGTVNDLTLLTIADDKSANLTSGSITTAAFTFTGVTTNSKFALASGTSLDATNINDSVAPNYYNGAYFDTSGGGKLVRTMTGSELEYRVGNSTSATVITLNTTVNEKVAVGVTDSVKYDGVVVTGIQDTVKFTTVITRNWGGTSGNDDILVTENWSTALEGTTFDQTDASLFVLSGGWQADDTIALTFDTTPPAGRNGVSYTLPHNGTYAIANTNADMTIPYTGPGFDGNIAYWEMSNSRISPRYDSFYLDVDNVTNFPIGQYPYFSSSVYPMEASVGRAVYDQMQYRMVTNPLTNMLGGQVPPIGSIVGQAITEGASLTLTSDAPVYLEVNGEYSIGAGWLPFGVPGSAGNIEQYQSPITQGQLDEFYLDFGGREDLFETPASFRSDLDEMLDNLLAG